MAGLLGCHSSTEPDGELHEVAMMKAIPNRDLDILFVIDNSPSMADQQVALAAAFPQMIDVLGQIDGGLPNLHIGVVTSDMGTSATASTTPAPAIGQIDQGGCSGRGDDGRLQTVAAMTDNFLSDVDHAGTRVRNFTGELRDVFGELARVGAGGCGFEQHLSAMQQALTRPDNANFIRPDANLAVVILADEDDCSARSATLFGQDVTTLGPLQSFRCFRHGVTCDPDVSSIGGKHNCEPRADSPYIEALGPFIKTLRDVKPDPRMLMVAGIVGDPAPVSVELQTPPGGGSPIPALTHVCSFETPSEVSIADPAIRLGAFLDAFPGHSTLTSVCSDDLSNPLSVIGQTAKKMIGDPCLDTRLLADASSELLGVQPSCEVVDENELTGIAVPLAPCSPLDSDCFEIVEDLLACPATGDHLRVRVRRTAAVTEDTWTHVRCQLESRI
jgi:hypothetical protein